MSQNNNNTSVGTAQTTSGMYYYPQYAYPYAYSYGSQSTQPISVDVNSKNKGEGRSTGLTVLKVIATILFIALTVGIGILAWKSYKKADKLMDKADKNQQTVNDIFQGKKELLIDNQPHTIGLRDITPTPEPSVGS